MLTELMMIAMLETASPCIEDREALLSLPQQDFDQDMQGGWRGIAYKDGCKEEAADLIAEYRTLNSLEGAIILWWHEGQLRADIGQTERAIALFRKAYHTGDDLDLYDRAWNFYADATIAFLERDYEALIAARDGLAGLPRPDDFMSEEELAEFEAKYNFRPEWPQNMSVVESLVRCYDKPYSEAYSRTCGLEEASE